MMCICVPMCKARHQRRIEEKVARERRDAKEKAARERRDAEEKAARERRDADAETAHEEHARNTAPTIAFSVHELYT